MNLTGFKTLAKGRVLHALATSFYEASDFFYNLGRSSRTAIEKLANGAYDTATAHKEAAAQHIHDIDILVKDATARIRTQQNAKSNAEHAKADKARALSDKLYDLYYNA